MEANEDKQLFTVAALYKIRYVAIEANNAAMMYLFFQTHEKYSIAQNTLAKYIVYILQYLLVL